MKAWPLSLLLVSCSSRPAPVPVATQPPKPSREEVVRTLSALERNFYIHWGALERTAEYRSFERPHVSFLREIADANGEHALMAYRVLRRLAPEEEFTDSAKAILYVSALEREENFIRWGALSKSGLLPGVYGDEMMALKGAVVPFLKKLLTNRRAAPVRGDDQAERANRRQRDRVCDYAWVFLSTLLDRPFSYEEEPAFRDPQIRELDLWLDRRR